MSYRTTPIIIVIATALAAGGCGDSGDSGDKPTSTDPPATVARAPYGLYTRTVTKDDLARTAGIRDEHGPEQMLPPAGRYRLVIAKGGAHDVIKVTDPKGFTVDQYMNVKPSVLQLTSYVNPDRAAFCGPEAPEHATYSFRSAAGSLTLSPRTSDGCADRDSLLTGTWAKG
jgi:hypothetical protein